MPSGRQSKNRLESATDSTLSDIVINGIYGFGGVGSGTASLCMLGQSNRVYGLHTFQHSLIGLADYVGDNTYIGFEPDRVSGFWADIEAPGDTFVGIIGVYNNDPQFGAAGFYLAANAYSVTILGSSCQGTNAQGWANIVTPSGFPEVVGLSALPSGPSGQLSNIQGMQSCWPSGFSSVDLRPNPAWVAPTYEYFPASGSSTGTFTASAHTTLVRLTGRGGSGGGGSGGCGGGGSSSSGAGGGGSGGAPGFGAVSTVQIVSVVPLQTYTVTIGAAGAGGAACTPAAASASGTTTPVNGNAGAAGGNTTFGSLATFYGGGGGAAGLGGVVTAGGAAVNSASLNALSVQAAASGAGGAAGTVGSAGSNSSVPSYNGYRTTAGAGGASGGTNGGGGGGGGSSSGSADAQNTSVPGAGGAGGAAGAAGAAGGSATVAGTNGNGGAPGGGGGGGGVLASTGTRGGAGGTGASGSQGQLLVESIN